MTPNYHWYTEYTVWYRRCFHFVSLNIKNAPCPIGWCWTNPISWYLRLSFLPCFYFNARHCLKFIQEMEGATNETSTVVWYTVLDWRATVTVLESWSTTQLILRSSQRCLMQLDRAFSVICQLFLKNYLFGADCPWSFHSRNAMVCYIIQFSWCIHQQCFDINACCLVCVGLSPPPNEALWLIPGSMWGPVIKHFQSAHFGLLSMWRVRGRQGGIPDRCFNFFSEKNYWPDCFFLWVAK